MDRVSVLIPARNEQYLEKTIRNVLANARGDIEIIVVLDGYLPDPQIHTGDERVTFLHNPEPIGQRQSINLAARHATGKYVMKLDAHCAVGIGFDVILKADCAYDWTVIPRMYNLDVETWTPKHLDDYRMARRRRKLHDYMFIGWNEKNEMRTLYYPSRLDAEIHTRTELIDETMSCMGCCFFMHTDRFWELGGCDEGHGGWGQQGVEVSLKAWLSGGKLIVNKKTWFAHWFRAGDGGFPYDISGRDVDRARDYSKDFWLNGKWPLQKRNLEWLINKFNAPTWEGRLTDEKMKTNNYLYMHMHKGKRYPEWRGVKILKLPSDLMLYHRILWETRPDLIIEIGTKLGGSALFLQDTLDMIGHGRVVTVDINPQVEKQDHRITYLHGDSTSPEIVSHLKELAQGKKTMVILDGDHHRRKVKWELHHYAPLVSKGQYLVLEDCYNNRGTLYGPGQARDWFLARNKEFVQTNRDEEFLVGLNIGGWLKRV